MNVEEALHILKENGYKNTNKREEILEFIFKQDKYTSAKELFLYLKKDYPGISFETIYSNLSLFHQLGILEETELNGEKKYQFSCSTDHHHHHIICLKCGKSQTLLDCPMYDLPDVGDFFVTGHKFEIYGYCQHCHS